MAGRNLGTLTLDLVAKIGGFVSGMDQATRASENWKKEVEKNARAAGVAFSGVASIGAAAMGVYIKNTSDAEKEQAQLKSALESTGGAAGFSRDELNQMSAAMEQHSTTAAGDITKAQTVLLTYTGIVGTEFKRAQQAVLDMATRTGQSVASAAEQIGRALDVPSKGMSSLSKQGFRFSEDQQQLIKQLEAAGKAAEAQGIILDALEESYLGAAQAARDTLPGALATLKNTLAGLLTGGDGALDGMKDAVNDLIDALNDPQVKASIDAIASSILNLAAVGAKSLKYVEVAAVAAGSVLIARLAGGFGAAAVGALAATAEAARYQLALASMAGVSATAAVRVTALGVASTAAAVAMRAAGAAMTLLGGPAGVAIAAASAIAYFAMTSKDASEDTAALQQRVDGLRGSYENLNAAQKQAATQDVRKLMSEEEAAARKLAGRIEYLSVQLRDMPGARSAQEWRDEIVTLNGKYADTQVKLKGLQGDLDKLAVAGKNASSAMSFDVPSKAFDDLRSKLATQIAMFGRETEEEKLKIRISLGEFEGMADWEKQSALFLARYNDNLVKTADAEKAAAAVARAAREQSAAAHKANLEAIESEVSALERAAKQWGMTPQQIQITTLEDKGASDQDIARSKAAQETVRHMESQRGQAEQLASIYSSLMTDDERRLFSLKEQRDTIKSFADSIASPEFKIDLDTRAFRAALGDFDKIEDAKAAYKSFAESVEESSIPAAEKIELISGALAWFEDQSIKIAENSKSWWDEWLENAEHALISFDDIAANTIDTFQAGMGDAFEKMVFDATSFDDAMKGMLVGMARGVVNSIGQMIAQWLAYRAVTSLVNKSVAAGGAAALTFNAIAAQNLAAINAYASTAAIPEIGPAAAPAAATAAFGATTPFVTAVASNAYAALGMAHDGHMSIPETGTWLLERGERVTTEETSIKLDRTLETIQRDLQARAAPEGARRMEVSLRLDSGLVMETLRNDDDFERTVLNIVRRAG